MVHVLIPTFPGDVHAIAVQIALEEKGHRATLWHTADFPAVQTATITAGPDVETAWEASGPNLAHDSSEQYDVVWNRRPMKPRPPAGMHPGDRIVAERESWQFMAGLWHFVSPGAFWVNPRESAPPKPLQLDRAKSAGLQIPPTLFSNDPQRIREFFAEYPKVVYKPFYPAQWKQDGGVAHLFTSRLTAEDLTDDDVLQLCPGIFQPELDKAYELRVTVMGATCIAVKLSSQVEPAAQLDWRGAGWEIPVEPISLPTEVETACLQLMKRLNLVFGCLDFVVTPAGDHIFLEVNEMGQFLWLEEMHPALRLLDAFSDFLIARRPDFTWRQGHRHLSYLDYRDGPVREMADTCTRRHIDIPPFQVVSDMA